MILSILGFSILVLVFVRWRIARQRVSRSALLLRLVALSCVIAALALGQLRQTSSIEQIDIVLLIDVSASISDPELATFAITARGIADANFAARMWALPFASDSLVEAPVPLDNFDFSPFSGTRSASPYDRTDIEHALHVAHTWALGRPDKVRLVLLSDGLCNPGNIPTLAETRIPLDLALIPPTNAQAFVSDIIAGRIIEQGGEVKITANLHAGRNTEYLGKTIFSHTGQPLSCIGNEEDNAIALKPGQHKVVSCRVGADTTRDWRPGLHQLAVRCAGSDTVVESYLRVVADEGPLLVGSTATAYTFWQEVLGDQAKLQAAPVSRLRSHLDPTSVPMILLDGSGMDTLDAEVEKQLIAYLYNGGTLVAMQGKSARGLDRLAGTRLQDFLPLTPLSEQDVNGKALFVAAFDVSLSMDFVGDTLHSVMDLAYSTMAMLLPDDTVCTYAMGDRPWPILGQNDPCITIKDPVAQGNEVRTELHAIFSGSNRGRSNIAATLEAITKDLKEKLPVAKQRKASGGFMFIITDPFTDILVMCNSNTLDPEGGCPEIPSLSKALMKIKKLGFRVGLVIVDPEGFAVRSNVEPFASHVTCFGHHCAYKDFPGDLVKQLQWSRAGDDCFFGPMAVTHHCIVENQKLVNTLQNDAPCRLIVRKGKQLHSQFKAQRVQPQCTSRCDGLEVATNDFPMHHGLRLTRLSSAIDELLLVDRDDVETPIAALRVMRGVSSNGRAISIASDPASAFAASQDSAARQSLIAYYRALLVEGMPIPAASNVHIQLEPTGTEYLLRVSAGSGPFGGSLRAQLWNSGRTIHRALILEGGDFAWSQTIPAEYLADCPCILELGSDNQGTDSLGSITIYSSPLNSAPLALELGPGGQICPGLYQAAHASGGRVLSAPERLALPAAHTTFSSAEQARLVPPNALLWAALLVFFLDIVVDRLRSVGALKVIKGIFV